MSSNTWSKELDTWLLDASPALSFDWIRISTALLRQGQRGFSPDSCRIRFAELSGVVVSNSGFDNDTDELDLDDLLKDDSIIGEKNELTTTYLQPASATINRTPGQTIVSDSSAFDFDADAALAAADAELGALMNEALEKRGAHSLASETNITSIRDAAASTKAKEEALQSEMEVASKARKVRQEQMFDRVLESLGGPLDAAASARISAPYGSNLLPLHQSNNSESGDLKLKTDTESHLSSAELQRVASKKEEDDTIKAIADVSASFFTDLSVDSSNTKLGFSLASVEDVQEILRNHSEFSIADSNEDSVSGWDLILKDVRINQTSTISNVSKVSTMSSTSTLSSSSASSASSALSSLDIPTEGSGTDFAEVLAILNSEVRSKPKKIVKAVVPPSLPTQPPVPPQILTQTMSSVGIKSKMVTGTDPITLSHTKSLDAQLSVSEVSIQEPLPPIIDKAKTTVTTTSKSFLGKTLDIDEDEDDELDWRAQRAKLKSRVTSSLPLTDSLPRPLTRENIVDDDLFQFMQRGRDVLDASRKGLVGKDKEEGDDDNNNNDDDGDETGVKGLDESQLISTSQDFNNTQLEDIYPLYIPSRRRIGGGGEVHENNESKAEAANFNLQNTISNEKLLEPSIKETIESSLTDNEEEEEMAFSTLIRPRVNALPPSVTITQALRDEAASSMPLNLPWNTNIQNPVKSKIIRQPLNESQLLISTSVARGDPAHKTRSDIKK
jgi:hypothetical protein